MRARPLFLAQPVGLEQTPERESRAVDRERINPKIMRLRGNSKSNQFENGGRHVDDNPWNSYIIQVSTKSVGQSARDQFVIPAYTTSLVTTSTSYRTRGFLI